MTIGQRIAELRKKHNLSQEALGEELGVSRQSVSKWESDAALPEIDKLIALSKRFGVTVGYLLGVEEETARQAEAAEPEQSGPTEAEVLERYLDSLPRKKPMGRGKKCLLAVAVVIVAVCVVNYIDALESRINSLNNTVSNMSRQVSNVQSELYGISDDISTKIDEALKQEYGLLANWSMELVGLDYGEGVATVRLNAVLKNKADSAEALSFYARLTDGSYTTCQTEQWDEQVNSYTAELVLPITENDIVYYLSTPEGTVCLPDYYGLNDLGAGTCVQIWWSDIYGSWGTFGISGQFELDFEEPWLELKGVTDSLGEPKVTVRLMYNGAVMEELTLDEQSYAGNYSYRYNFSVQNDNIEGGVRTGDQVWIEYEIAYENGPYAAGYGNEIFQYDGTRWQAMAYDEAEVIDF